MHLIFSRSPRHARTLSAAIPAKACAHVHVWAGPDVHSTWSANEGAASSIAVPTAITAGCTARRRRREPLLEQLPPSPLPGRRRPHPAAGRACSARWTQATRCSRTTCSGTCGCAASGFSRRSRQASRTTAAAATPARRAHKRKRPLEAGTLPPPPLPTLAGRRRRLRRFRHWPMCGCSGRPLHGCTLRTSTRSRLRLSDRYPDAGASCYLAAAPQLLTLVGVCARLLTSVVNQAACEPMLGRAAAEGAGHATRRHLTQQASIIGHMLRRQLLQQVSQHSSPLPFRRSVECPLFLVRQRHSVCMGTAMTFAAPSRALANGRQPSSNSGPARCRNRAMHSSRAPVE